MIDLSSLTRIERLGSGPGIQIFRVQTPRGRMLALTLLHRLVAPGPEAAQQRAAIELRLAPFLGDGWREGLLPIVDLQWLDSLPDSYLGSGGPATADGQPDDRGTLALLAPYVNGESLRRVLARGPLPAGAVAGVLAQLLRALGPLHARSPPVGHGAVGVDSVRAYSGGGVALANPRLRGESSPGDDLRKLGELGQLALQRYPDREAALAVGADKESPFAPGSPGQAQVEREGGSPRAEAQAALEPLVDGLADGSSTLAGAALLAEFDGLRSRLGGNPVAPLQGRVVSRGADPATPPERPPTPPEGSSAPGAAEAWAPRMRAAAALEFSARREGWAKRVHTSPLELLLSAAIPVAVAALLVMALSHLR